MDHRENSDSQRSDQGNVAKDEHNCWSQENIDRAISICLGEDVPYEYSINEQKARDAATMEQTVQTTTLNPPQTQSRVQTSAGVPRERHTQRLSGDEFSTDGDEYTTPEDYCSKHISRPASTRTLSDLGHRRGHCSKNISRPASTRTVCDSGQGRGHYVKAVCILYNEVPNKCNSIQLRGGGGRDTLHTAVITPRVCIINNRKRVWSSHPPREFSGVIHQLTMGVNEQTVKRTSWTDIGLFYWTCDNLW